MPTHMSVFVNLFKEMPAERQSELESFTIIRGTFKMKTKLFLGKIFKNKAYMKIVKYRKSFRACMDKFGYSGLLVERLIKGMLPHTILEQEVSF